MNHNHLEAIQVVQKLGYRLKGEDYDAVDVSVHPPFIGLRSIQTLIDADNIPIALGAQNCHWEEKGAFTGEVSAPMLAKLQVRYVIVGHSERRALFGETDDIVNRKAQAVLKAGMTPTVCVGETLEQREAGEAEDVVAGQLRGSLAGIAGEALGGLVVAYEPVWAIGTGKTASAGDAQDMCAFVRRVVGELAESAAHTVRVQYGGSVNPGNAAELLGQPDIDGALVGGASLDPDDFSKIVTAR
jgi:triosephosphate isomerase